MASPPGLFSTTTGLPHFAASLSAISRAVMSTPEPGPSGTMKRTERVGQDCVCASAGVDRQIAATVPKIRLRRSIRVLRSVFVAVAANLAGEGRGVNAANRKGHRIAAPLITARCGDDAMRPCAGAANAAALLRRRRAWEQ